MLTNNIKALVDQFPYHKVFKTMITLDWRWGEKATPGTATMKAMVTSLFEHLLANNSTQVSTGGFTVYKETNEEGEVIYGIRFVAAELDTECIVP